MLVYRICRRGFRELDGEGARINGGRWNTPGTAVVYCSASLSLAALEYLVHLDPDVAPADLVALTIELPSHVSSRTVEVSELPPEWRDVTEHPECQAIGDRWARERETAALRVPAAIVPEEHNVLVNPRHPLAAQMRVVREHPFAFDPRLLG